MVSQFLVEGNISFLMKMNWGILDQANKVFKLKTIWFDADEVLVSRFLPSCVELQKKEMQYLTSRYCTRKRVSMFV